MLVKNFLSYKQFLVFKGLVDGFSMHRTSRNTGVTISHTIKITNDFILLGLLEKHDIGKRSKKIIITSKGKKIFELYVQILNLFCEELEGGIDST